MDTLHVDINVDCKYSLLRPQHQHIMCVSIIISSYRIPLYFRRPIKCIVLRNCSAFFIVLVAAICVLLRPSMDRASQSYCLGRSEYMVCIPNLFIHRYQSSYIWHPPTWIAISDELYICCVSPSQHPEPIQHLRVATILHHTSGWLLHQLSS